MRSKDPELMKKIYQFADEYYCIHHESPSCRDIAVELGIGRATAHRYLVAMDEKGMISYNSGDIKTSQIEKCKTGYFAAPIVGTIRCGDPEMEEEQIEEYVNLPESIFGKGEFYILRATGDSMIDADIYENDLIVIQKNCQAYKGDIVVALDNENQNTLKRFIGFDEDSQCYILKYENEEKYPGKTIKLKSFTVQGVAKNIIKKL